MRLVYHLTRVYGKLKIADNVSKNRFITYTGPATTRRQHLKMTPHHFILHECLGISTLTWSYTNSVKVQSPVSALSELSSKFDENNFTFQVQN